MFDHHANDAAMLRLEYRPTCAEDGSGDETIIEKQDKSLGMKNKVRLRNLPSICNCLVRDKMEFKYNII